MSWFKKHKQYPSVGHQPSNEPVVLTPSQNSRVEVEVHKDATKEVAEKAKNANEHLKELLVNNGFTLKIYLAAHQPSNNRKSRNL
jgi:hypothetical protein